MRGDYVIARYCSCGSRFISRTYLGMPRRSLINWTVEHAAAGHHEISEAEWRKLPASQRVLRAGERA